MNKNIIETDASHVWHPYSPLLNKRPVAEVVSAKGMYLHLADGTTLLDAISSWWVNIHGHANEALATAVKEQILSLDHTLFAGFTHKPAVEFATRFLNVVACKQQRVFYSENGSTAVEVALKLAVQYWKNKGEQKTTFIAIEGSFHGDTFGAMSVSARGLFTEAFESLLNPVVYIPFPDGSNDDLVLSKIESYIKAGNIAAFIYEPLIQGTAGMRIYGPEILDKMIRLCKQYSVLCIADEVMTGFGRTGKKFASHYCETHPDMMCFSKAITGGLLPLGVTTCTREVEAPFLSEAMNRAFFHGHSYTANATICKLALTSLNIFESDACQENIKRIETAHKNFLLTNVNHKNIKRIQALGTILAIEVQTSNSTTNYEHEIRHFLYD
ncbi:MAG TPA: adenosylmethionine--8-amino-7-oxononanoate transaminase, partial [Cytophaga sp.]|nr:adenosylmethionine--8-amino-7-oxononanoate transaminase [Cytophaga sp.]